MCVLLVILVAVYMSYINNLVLADFSIFKGDLKGDKWKKGSGFWTKLAQNLTKSENSFKVWNTAMIF